MSTLAHGKDVPLDRATLRTIAKHNSKPVPDLGRLACAGVYANIIATGQVQVGDVVRFEPKPHPAEENTA
ncbi:hypothetical protein BST33_00380 [Mycolicibacter minnesotensis]|uniref:Uncharacterized protein n=1 Tax=Mycolicibacter minnesotensis TaxID=1118379 RepID=A0A7I7RA95_9MYCO|nr:MOSC domain-containing protein [Mycolicibacter minnesotensis]ORB04393.1 hypothetical protein BST33_00380 [Mycolicibacter minnesotensis]BBY34976.1 hypothetical protein MMIN_30370 [Mycolicibacter minnesotensis]